MSANWLTTTAGVIASVHSSVMVWFVDNYNLSRHRCVPLCSMNLLTTPTGVTAVAHTFVLNSFVVKYNRCHDVGAYLYIGLVCCQLQLSWRRCTPLYWTSLLSTTTTVMASVHTLYWTSLLSTTTTVMASVHIFILD